MKSSRVHVTVPLRFRSLIIDRPSTPSVWLGLLREISGENFRERFAVGPRPLDESGMKREAESFDCYFFFLSLFLSSFPSGPLPSATRARCRTDEQFEGLRKCALPPFSPLKSINLEELTSRKRGFKSAVSCRYKAATKSRKARARRRNGVVAKQGREKEETPDSREGN